MNPSIPVAAMLGRTPETIRRLLKEGGDINENHPVFGFSLHQAIQQRRPLEYIAFLLEAGADPNARDADNESVLSFAQRGKANKEVLDLLHSKAK